MEYKDGLAFCQSDVRGAVLAIISFELPHLEEPQEFLCLNFQKMCVTHQSFRQERIQSALTYSLLYELLPRTEL